MDIKRIQTAESFVLEGKLPCQQQTERGGQQGNPFLDGKAYSTEKISAHSFQAGRPYDLHVIRQWWAKHPSIVSAMHAFCDPPDPQFTQGSLGWRVGVAGWEWAAPARRPKAPPDVTQNHLPSSHPPQSLSSCISGNKV